MKISTRVKVYKVNFTIYNGKTLLLMNNSIHQQVTREIALRIVENQLWKPW